MTEAIKPAPDLAAYARPRLGRSLLDVTTSVVPYLALSALMYGLATRGSALVWVLAIPAAAFLLRTFIVFHDCAHGSFFSRRRSNLWFGRLCALLVWQAFSNWRHEHAVHHGSAGDLDRRGTGDVTTLTVTEYYGRSQRGRLAYRLFRNPLVMFAIGPIWSLMIGPRLSAHSKRTRLRRSIVLTNLGLAALIGLQCWLLGWQAFVVVIMPPALLAASAGVWLFYVQHQFEDVYWETGTSWSYDSAALQGSSYLKLPAILQFITGNIGLHHVHHLNAKVPNYNLQRAHDENPVFRQVPVLTLAESLRCVRLKLIDTESGRLVTWGAARAIERSRNRSAARAPLSHDVADATSPQNA
jgi:omega-6 fatty acid desaturase (delta-12 desaturase)